VEVTISDQSGSNAPMKKSISVTVGDGSQGSVRSGVTIPVPSSMTVPKEGAERPFTSYNYKDVGLSLDVDRVVVQGGLVRLRIAVEYNPVDEKTVGTEGATVSSATGLPSFARFSQSLSLVLEDGKPLIVAQSSDPVPSRSRLATLEVKATILR
jgi:type II secretory pathway component GspD/PulD (secretin)